MTAAGLCDDFMLLAVFMLIGFFLREIVKPIQKLFLPDSLVGGLLLLLPEEKKTSIGKTVTNSISINHLALQFSWLLAAVFLGDYIFDFVGNYIPFVESLPGVLRGIFGGAFLWQLLRVVKLDKYVDLKTIKTISGFLLEIVIFTAMATLDLEFVSAYMIPVLIYTFVLALITIPVILGLSYKFCKTEWFEKACMAYGAAVGNTSTGLALVRAIDPESKSSAGDTHGVYSAIMSWKDVFVGLAPAWLMSGTAVTMGVGFAIMLGFAIVGFLLFGRKGNGVTIT